MSGQQGLGHLCLELTRLDLLNFFQGLQACLLLAVAHPCQEVAISQPCQEVVVSQACREVVVAQASLLVSRP